MSRAVRYSLSTTGDGRLWFSVALRDGWTACYLLAPHEGRPTVVELRVVPTPPGVVVHTRPDGSPQGHHLPPAPAPPGLTAKVLKDRVIVGRHIYELLPQALRSARDGALGRTTFRPVDEKGHAGEATTLFGAFFGQLIDPDKPPQRGRRGPKGWGDAEYAQIAAVYLSRIREGSRSPVADVAKERGMTDVGARAALTRARRRGLLTKQTPGRAGGELTPRAKALLKKDRRK